MSNHKRKIKGKAHTAYFSHVGLIQLAPSRESRTPFCTYYGPNGETCSNTTGLQTVFTLPSTPPYAYMACPLHHAAVSQMVQAFLAKLETLSKQV